MNIHTSPSTGAISFNTDAAGSSTVSLTTFPRFQYDGAGGISIISTSTGAGFTDKFKVESSGRLFTVTDATTGVVMDVTNALGLPILEVYSLEPQTTITMGPYGTSAFVLNNTKLGLGTATPTARLHLPAGTSSPNTAPLKLTTQAEGLSAVEQGTMELVGNSLQFTQLAKRRGVMMSQSVMLASLTLGGADSAETQAVFTASITGSTMTVTAVSSGKLFVGMQVYTPGLNAATWITALGTGTGGTGTYTVVPTQTIASTTFNAAIIAAEHGANYIEVGKHEVITLVGTITQRSNAAASCSFRIKYAGVTVQTVASPATTNIGVPTPFTLRVNCTFRETGATGKVQINSFLEIAGNVVDNGTVSAPVTIDTTTAQNTTVTAQWGESNAANILVVHQGYVTCVEPNR